MPPSPLDDLDPNTEVFVSPVHLAGAGSRDVVFNILDSAPGWSKTVAFETDTYYTSPCQRVRIANPLESYYGGWTITFSEDPLGVPDWISTFDRGTPNEAVAAFARVLVHSLPGNFRDYFSDGKHYGPGPEQLIRDGEWEFVRGSRPHLNVAPDGHMALRTRDGWVHEYNELLVPAKSLWRLSAGPDPVHAPTWRAFFSGKTHPHLRAAAIAALISSTPVPRFAADIPEHHHRLVDVHRTAPTATVRAQAALTRTPHVPKPTSAINAPTLTTNPRPAHGRSRRQR
ncbi:DUF317 domain-containing protein [Streptomyces sp. NPDC050264]|uniref:DUF317 domain-containing protein n=1 Tax=Streptomyces sp. NPDC050264 TaxID=3155038 RepID=UPI003442E831